MKLDGIIFDMDGTLVDSLGLWQILWEELGEKYFRDPGFWPGPEDDKAIRTMALRDGMYRIHRNYQMAESGEALFLAADGIFRRFYREQVTLKPGVREWLEFCKSQKIPMVIASATAPELIRIALEHCQAEHYFQRIFSCTEVGKGKEAPDVFLAACRYLHTAVEHSWIFEDSALAIQTAAAAGFPSVAIYDPCNMGQQILEETATIYLGPGHTMEELIPLALKSST